MSNLVTKILVARVQSGGETYYLSMDYPGGVTLDSELYLPYLLSVNGAEKVGNFGDGSQYGNAHVVILNGEKWFQGAYLFDVTNVWNNQPCEIRECDVSTDTTWAACAAFYKGIIKNITIAPDKIEFDVDDHDYRDDKILPESTPEDLVTAFGHTDADIPNASRGKRVPMQYGQLNDTANGIFGKILLITNRIGQQRFQVDTEPVHTLTSIGMWENGLRRYFAGRSRWYDTNTAQWVGEYEGGNGLTHVEMKINVATGLAVQADAVTGTDTIEVDDYTKIEWYNEDSVYNWENVPEVIGANIIGIDNELMLLIEQPTSNQLTVERGFNGTTPVVHAAGSTIYACATFASRNVLTFQERFDATSLTNFYCGRYIQQSVTTALGITQFIASGSFSNITNLNKTDYFESWIITDESDIPAERDALTFINFDARFGRIEDSFPVFRVLSGCKATVLIREDDADPSSAAMVAETGIAVFYPTETTATYNSKPDDAVFDMLPVVMVATLRSSNTVTIDQLDAPLYTNVNTAFPEKDYYIQDVTVFDDNFGINDLLDLNKRFKYSLYQALYAAVDPLTTFQYMTQIRIYNIGFWIQMFADFTKRRSLFNGIGRTSKLSYYSALFGFTWATLPTLYPENPVDVLASVLWDDLEFAEGSFDLTTWQAVRAYYADIPNSAAANPAVALSYGIDESLPGWDWCQWLAAQFNLSLIRGYDGKIKILNLHRLQYKDETYGYPSMTAYAIPLDTLLVQGGVRKITVKQTGTDMLKNDVIVRYKRNNSTDEFQAAYPGADDSPDAYVMPESLITLAQARNTYYNGKKTELLEIEAPAITNATDAQRLWEWNINDKAEVFFYVVVTMAADHYTVVNAKAAQYEVGDVAYLDGVYTGLVFNSSRKFVIRKTAINDNGREITLEMKSIEPISEFTSTATGQNATEQDTIDSDDIMQDTIDSDTIHHDKI